MSIGFDPFCEVDEVVGELDGFVYGEVCDDFGSFVDGDTNGVIPCVDACM